VQKRAEYEKETNKGKVGENEFGKTKVSLLCLLHSCVFSRKLAHGADSLSSQQDLHLQSLPIPIPPSKGRFTSSGASPASLLSSASNYSSSTSFPSLPSSAPSSQDVAPTVLEDELYSCFTIMIANTPLPKIFITNPSLRQALVSAVKIGQLHPKADPEKLVPTLTVFRLNNHIVI
jgi:hypothetical protein